MQKRVLFVHGKIIAGFYCPWCDVRRSGRCVKETYKWRVILKCGHVINRGYTLPPEELERKGYINQKGTEDPRFTARKKELFRGVMALREEVLRQRWIKENLAGGRAVY